MTAGGYETQSDSTSSRLLSDPKAEFLMHRFAARSISFDLWRLDGYRGDPSDVKNRKISDVIDVTAISNDEAVDLDVMVGLNDDGFLLFQNKTCRDMTDSVTRFAIPARLSIEEIADVLVHSDLIVGTADSSDPRVLKVLEATRDAIAREVWDRRLTDLEMMNWLDR